MKDLKIFAEQVGPKALNQIYELMDQPTFNGERIRIMPDAHAGVGCVVGFTSTMTDKVIPNIIGVDIGCGMLTVELGKMEIDLPALDKFIKNRIPAGSGVRRESNGLDLIEKLYCYDELKDMKRLTGAIGSLGGGNHFIEIDRDEEDNLYLVVHSGSRNLGQQVAKIYQRLAIERCKGVGEEEREALIARLKAENRQADIDEELKKLNEKYAYKSKIPAQLCYLEGKDMENYMHDMRLCQQLAQRNRRKIADDICAFLSVKVWKSFETVHNFIDDKGIIRKGAVPAHKGERLLIPMNMRDGCIVAIGKGNEDWNCSAPHGAGRLLSRSDARTLLSVEEFKSEMAGIYTTTANEHTLDESPMAYKPMDRIVELIKPTVDIERIIKPIYNFKSP